MLPPVVRILREACGDQPVQRSRRQGLLRRERRRVVLEDGRDERRFRISGKCAPSGHHFMEDRTEREEIGRASASSPRSCSGAM